MDTGVNRKVANSVPVTLRRVAGEGGRARFDSVTNTERAMNLRFKYASRRLRVPYVYPGYFVLETVKQATLTGSEHRRALPYLPFAVAGVVGPAGDSDEHRAVLQCVCELVALTNSLFAVRGPGSQGVSLSEAALLAKKAHEWVVDHFQPVLGPAHTTKLHRVSAHLLDEFRLRGNVFDGDSAFNESLHKAVKAAYRTTNKRRDQFVEQLIINEQVHAALIEEDDDSRCSVRSDDGGAESRSPPPRSVACKPRGGGRRVRHRYTRKQSVAQLAATRNLPGLASALGCDDAVMVCPRSSMYFGSAPGQRGRSEYTIRASPCFHGSPWFDWVRYRAEDGELRVGQAAIVLCNRAGTWQRLTVRRATKVAAEPGCVLTQYGCERLRWDVTPGGTAASLDVLRQQDIVSYLVVEHDWEDLSTRHGVTVMPDEVPNTSEELCAARFFVNCFATQGTRAVDGAESEEDSS